VNSLLQRKPAKLVARALTILTSLILMDKESVDKLDSTLMIYYKIGNVRGLA
jgi:hypothetical protein